MDNEVSILMHQSGYGVAFVYVLQWAKQSKYFPWLSQNSGSINRWIGIGFTFLVSAGMKYAVSENADGSHHIVLDIPTFGALVDVFAHTLAQFGGQQILYHAAVKDTVGSMATQQMASGHVEGAVVQVAVGETKQQEAEKKDA